jgi:eukaryotic-like serine/threonine-protein kinase
VPRPELPEWLTAHWPSIEGQAEGLEGDLSQTLRPTLAGTTSRVQRAVDAPLGRGLRLGETLGSGGMGIVRSGTQESLERTVAIKALRSGRRGAHDVLKLLQEAWVAARLEHPNIVPVYDIAEDEDGLPLLVMRRIEGQSWGELAQDEAAVRDRFGAEDLLEWNLRVLMQVANAVHFAHSRAVLHLDLKPSNVMIGAFGEVYLVDWGLAMSLDPAEDRLPRAADNTEIIGTAAYVAPEMLTSDGEWLSERTDVYLLGSCLFELLAGEPPHRGATHVAVFFNAATKDPEVPADAPAELARLCSSALSRSPEERPESAEEFRLGLQAFLRHRGSARLAAGALRALDELSGVAPGHDRETHTLATEARFGFQQALAAWPENPEAQAGFRRATILLAQAALDAGDLTTAESLATELAPADPGLGEALSRARDDLRRHEEELRQLRTRDADLDPRTGQRTRVFLTGLMGVLWILAPLPAALSPDAAWLQSTPLYLATPVLFLGVALCLAVWARESMLSTEFNRRAGAMVFIALSGQLVMTVAAWQLGVPHTDMLPLFMVLWATVSAAFSVTVEPRGWIFTAGFLAASAVSVVWPPTVFWAMSASSAVFFGTLVATWWPDNLRGPVGMDPIDK